MANQGDLQKLVHLPNAHLVYHVNHNGVGGSSRYYHGTIGEVPVQVVMMGSYDGEYSITSVPVDGIPMAIHERYHVSDFGFVVPLELMQ